MRLNHHRHRPGVRNELAGVCGSFPEEPARENGAMESSIEMKEEALFKKNF